MSYADAADPKIIEDLLRQQPDQLIFCLTPDSRAVAEYEKTYLQPAQIVSRMAKKWAPNCHLIFVSSTSVYAQNSGEPVDENSLTNPQRETAQIMLKAEAAIAESGNPWSVVRFSGIYGPGRERLLNKVLQSDFTDADEVSWTNRIHSDDCASVLEHLITHPQLSTQGAGILIATDSTPVLNTEAEVWLAEKLKVSPPNKTASFQPSGKRCSNLKLLSQGFALQYPGYREGYGKLIESRRPSS